MFKLGKKSSRKCSIQVDMEVLSVDNLPPPVRSCRCVCGWWGAGRGRLAAALQALAFVHDGKEDLQHGAIRVCKRARAGRGRACAHLSSSRP